MIPENIGELTVSKPAETFIVICGKREPWIDGDLMDRATVINTVSSGEYNDLRQIIAFSLSAGTCRDATKDICEVVIERWAQDDKLLSEKEFEFVELCAGINVARSFRMECA